MYPGDADFLPAHGLDHFDSTQYKCPMCNAPDETFGGGLNVGCAGTLCDGEYRFCTYCGYWWHQNFGDPKFVNGDWAFPN